MCQPVGYTPRTNISKFKDFLLRHIAASQTTRSLQEHGQAKASNNVYRYLTS